MTLSIQVGAIVASLAFGSTRGSGTIKQETRTVGTFSGVAVGSGIRATVTIGPNTSVVVSGDDNLLPMIKSEVANGVLAVKVDNWGGISPSQPIRVTVVTPSLTSASASGGASVTADATAGPKFEASASGGGSVSVKGVDSKSVSASASGGATVNLSNLKAESAEVDGSGGATVSLSGSVKKIKTKLSGGAGLKAQDIPLEALQVSASGGSRVYAQVSTEVSGNLSGGSTLHLKGNPTKHNVETSGGSKVHYQ